MALKNVGGQLVEEEESLMDKVNKAGADQAPITPLGASTVGATPDQAKMAGTPAQKQNVLRDAVEKESTLAYRQQVKAGPAEQTEQQKQQIEKQKQFSSLGSLGARVQQQTEQMFATAAASTLDPVVAVNEDAIITALGFSPEQAVAGAEQIAAVTAATQAYMQNPTQEGLQALVETHGLSKSDVYNMTGMLEDGTAATGKALSQAMADEVLVGELDFTDLGFGSAEDLSAALGQDVSGMTVPELNEAIVAAQQDSMDQAAELQAQIASLPKGSMERRALEGELTSLGDVGIRVSEAEVEEAIEKIDMAEEITIGGETYQLDELLKDEGISELVNAFMQADDETKDKILPPEQYGDLRNWIGTNQAALGSMQTQAEQVQQEFEKVQDTAAGYSDDTGISPEVLATMGLDPDKTYTKEELDGITEAIGKTSYGKIANSDIDGQADIMMALNDDPVLAATMDSWTPEQIESSHNSYTAALADPTLAALIPGFDPDSPFITADQMAGMETAQAIAALPFSEQLVKTEGFADWAKTTDGAAWVAAGEIPTDKDMLSFIMAGELKPEDLKPGWETGLSEYKDDKRLNTQIANGDINAVLDEAFGYDVDPDEIQSWIDQAEAAAAMGDTTAQSQLDEYKKLMDPNTFKSTLTLKDRLAGKTDPQIKAPSLFRPDVKNEKSKALHDMMSDGTISFDEISEGDTFDLTSRADLTILSELMDKGLTDIDPTQIATAYSDSLSSKINEIQSRYSWQDDNKYVKNWTKGAISYYETTTDIPDKFRDTILERVKQSYRDLGGYVASESDKASAAMDERE